MIVFILLNTFENFLFPNYPSLVSRFNPAYLAERQKMILFGGGEQFGLSALRTWMLDIQVNQFGFNLKSFGNELYRENLLEFGNAILVFKQLSIGLGTTLLNSWIKDNSNRFTYSLKIGGLYKTPVAEIGLLAGNINQPRFSYIDYIPFIYYVNSKYNVNRNFALYFNIAGKEDDPPYFNFGFALSPMKELKVSLGMNTENFLFEYGMGLLLGNLSLNYSGSSHRQLGLSHALFVNFQRN